MPAHVAMAVRRHALRSTTEVPMSTLDALLCDLVDEIASDGACECPVCDGRMTALVGRLAGLLRCDGCGAELEGAPVRRLAANAA